MHVKLNGDEESEGMDDLGASDSADLGDLDGGIGLCTVHDPNSTERLVEYVSRCTMRLSQVVAVAYRGLSVGS